MGRIKYVLQEINSETFPGRGLFGAYLFTRPDGLSSSSRALDLSLKETRAPQNTWELSPVAVTSDRRSLRRVTSDHGLCLLEKKKKVILSDFIRNSRNKHTTKWKGCLIQKSYFHSFHRDCRVNQPSDRKPSFRGHSTETVYQDLLSDTKAHFFLLKPEYGKTTSRMTAKKF